MSLFGHTINELKIPRWVKTTNGCEIELFGFSDASVLGYGAAVYIRCAFGQNYTCYLLTSKTKVSPVQTVTIPRLELNAAVLLARLMNILRQKTNLENVPYHCFSDSLVALSWIASCPSALKFYVGVRVKRIHENTPKERWSYVPSKENPADIASRGMSAEDLIKCSLWWHGPQFLIENQNKYVQPELTEEERKLMSSETKPVVSMRVAINSRNYLSMQGILLIERYSNLQELIRITAYVQKPWYQFRMRRNLTQCDHGERQFPLCRI